jgi:hydroxyacylglutathione hydrolase
MYFERVKTPGLGHNAYVLGCGEGLAVVIDPRRDVEEYLCLAREEGLSIAYVLETHRQEDFEFGSRALAEATGAEIVGGCHPLFGEIDVKLEDGQELKVGKTRFVALATPGHTPESMSYAVYAEDSGEKCWGVFTGDALFVGDTGRTDLTDPDRTGENAGILYDAIHRKIGPLGDQALLFPAHGAGSACGANISERDDSTIGIERETNDVFTKSRSEFVADKEALHMARPPYFRHMEEVNLLPGRPLEEPPASRMLPPREFQRRMKEGLVIDTRPPAAFAGAHIPGAYNIWLDGVPAYGGWVANKDTRVFLVAEGREAMEQAAVSLARIGIDTVAGILATGMEGWRDEGLPLESLGTTTAAEASQWMQEGRVRVLDVRDQYEWDEKHIPGAVRRYVGHLEDDLPQWPKDADIVVHCNVGHRSGLAASILKRSGFTRIHNMLGGITAWEKLGLPLELSDEAKKKKAKEEA